MNKYLILINIILLCSVIYYYFKYNNIKNNIKINEQYGNYKELYYIYNPISVIIDTKNKYIDSILDKILKNKYIDDIIINNNITNITSKSDMIRYKKDNIYNLAKYVENKYILFIDKNFNDSKIDLDNLIINLLKKNNNDYLESKQNIYGIYSYKDLVIPTFFIINKDNFIKIWDTIINSKYYNYILTNEDKYNMILSYYVKLYNGVHRIYEINDHDYDKNNLAKIYNIINNDYINNYFQQKIEKNIMMCGPLDKIEDYDIMIQENIKKLKKENPDYTFYYYNTFDKYDFVKQNYNAEIYKKIINFNDCYGAGRADLFRYLWIYKNGGIYLDLKSSLLKPLNQIVKPYDDIIFHSWDKAKSKNKNMEDYVKTGFGEISQWNIISCANNKFLEKIINNVLLNLECPFNNKGHIKILKTTGPVVYTNSVMKNVNNYNYTFKYNNNNLKYSIFENDTYKNKIYKNIKSYHTCEDPIMKVDF